MTGVVILRYQGKDLLKLQASGYVTGWLSTNPSARTLNISFSVSPCIQQCCSKGRESELLQSVQQQLPIQYLGWFCYEPFGVWHWKKGEL